ncbi:protein kinase domain-containing protein [Mycobacterium genavense]|uniref:protein kinase domain-containing protein n=1 Tax=Mycobacterium genavense TaxID=36812 RepID=UPI0004AD6B56
MIEQVAAALDTAHEVGLIHRDIKPSNILVSARDFVYLIDFGLARTAADTVLTHTGHTMGTMAYMAPERFRGMTDHRADIYALACVLYECLTGHLAYPGDTFEEQLNAHLNAPPPRPSFTAPGVPPVIDDVVARGMAKDLNRRYQTAVEFANAAKAALSGAGNPAPPSPPPPHYPATAAAPAPPSSPAPPPQQQRSSRALIIGSVAASIFTLAMVTILVVALVTNSDSGSNSATSSTVPHPRTLKQGPAFGAPGAPSTPAAPNPNAAPPLPAFAPPSDLGANCQYQPVGNDSVDASPKPVNLPPSGRLSTTPAQIPATISTNFGDIGIELANGESPCTVNSFVSLVHQQFFDGTTCPQLSTGSDGAMLSCGGPDKDGNGGPGYEFADEYPTNQYPPRDPALRATVVYPRGSVIMASNEPNTNGSQFVMVYQDTEALPTFTLLGNVDQAGLAVLDKIAAAGVAGHRLTGLPTSPVTINSVRLG